jgi:hypothetical protein
VDRSGFVAWIEDTKNIELLAKSGCIGLLIGFEDRRAVIWRVFSEVVKLEASVTNAGPARTDLYDFHELIINRLRPALKEGSRSIRS